MESEFSEPKVDSQEEIQETGEAGGTLKPKQDERQRRGRYRRKDACPCTA